MHVKRVEHIYIYTCIYVDFLFKVIALKQIWDNAMLTDFFPLQHFFDIDTNSVPLVQISVSNIT